MNLLRSLARPRTLAERYLERGLYNLDRRQYDDALADLTEAIAHEPRSAELYTTRGLVYVEAGKKDYVPYARADFEYALTLDPGQMVAHYGLGMIAYGQEKYDEALEHFNAARDIAPLRPEIYYFRALSYFQMGDAQRALDEMDIAMPMFDPGDPRHLDAARWKTAFKKRIKPAIGRGRRKSVTLPEVDPRLLDSGES